jgi:hypothetical protein
VEMKSGLGRSGGRVPEAEIENRLWQGTFVIVSM